MSEAAKHSIRTLDDINIVVAVAEYKKLLDFFNSEDGRKIRRYLGYEEITTSEMAIRAMRQLPPLMKLQFTTPTNYINTNGDVGDGFICIGAGGYGAGGNGGNQR